MPAVVGFTVACSSPGAPGIDSIGDFTFRLSLKYEDGKTIYVDVPVHGKEDKDDPSGDDTSDVAKSAAAAVARNNDLSDAQKAGISVQTDGGGPGNTLGRILIDDPLLREVDAACNDTGKVQIEIVWTGSGSRPGGSIFEGTAPNRRRWRTTRKGANPVKPPPKPGGGDVQQRYVDPSRPWRRVQGLIVIGTDGLAGAVGCGFQSDYLDGLDDGGLTWIAVPFDVRESPQEQSVEILDRLQAAGVSCVDSGGSVLVRGFSRRPDAPIVGLGVRYSLVPGIPGVPWDMAIESAGDGLRLVVASNAASRAPGPAACLEKPAARVVRDGHVPPPLGQITRVLEPGVVPQRPYVTLPPRHEPLVRDTIASGGIQDF